MAEDQNFDNGTQEFNIHLDESGNLNFNANGKNGEGDTRMVIADNSGEVTIGGSGQSGQLQLKSSTGANTLFLGGTGSETVALLGGAGKSGRVQLNDSSGRRTVDLDGRSGVLILGADGIDGDLSVLDGTGAPAITLDGEERRLELFSSAGVKRADLQGDIGRLQLLNFSGVITADLRGDAGSLVLGGANGTDGDLILTDESGAVTINCDGQAGSIECVSLTETSDKRLKTEIAALTNSLDSVLTLRGVRYIRKQSTAPMATAADDAPQIGFVGQEVEVVCPELVTTDAEGYKSVNYSRMTAVLVEAVKEQQQQIREQTAALGEALRKISIIEASLAAHAGAQQG